MVEREGKLALVDLAGSEKAASPPPPGPPSLRQFKVV